VATIVRFSTSVGNIDVRLYDGATPNSVANFLNYSTTNKYNGTFIHRVPQNKDANDNNLGTQNFVVQGGGFLLNNSIWAASGIATNAPIGDEPGISNIRATLSFAKNAAGATSQWFFNIGDNSALDLQNFTVFGRVLSGMGIVDSINNLPAVNAKNAQNAPGEDFDEIPVRNIQQVLNQNDITSNEAVMVNSVTILNLPAGDYDGNGVANSVDYSIWRSTYNFTTNAQADGNGNGKIDAADYVMWRNTSSGSGGGGEGLSNFATPEPSAAILLLSAGFMLALRRGIFGRRK